MLNAAAQFPTIGSRAELCGSAVNELVSLRAARTGPRAAQRSSWRTAGPTAGGSWRRGGITSAHTASVFGSSNRTVHYQIILILKGVVQGGDPLTISIHQHVAFFPETCRLQEIETIEDANVEIKK